MSEEFEINYYYMGQGDCILIVCPNGQVVMIDCGSSKGFGGDNKKLLDDVCVDVREAVGSRCKIDILILTHRDRDHYNLVNTVFSDTSIRREDQTYEPIGALDIDTVYFSSPPVIATCALGGFTAASCASAITQQNFKTRKICQVFINDDQQEALTYTSDDHFATSAVIKTAIQNKKYPLLDGLTSGGHVWRVSLIAGHVQDPNQKTEETNVLSLVTLLEIGNSKGLFLGDATIVTENFLIKNHSSLIRNVDFVHIPHHGGETSSGQNFVSLVNPHAAQVTHETYESRYKHPQEGVLRRWLEVLTPKVGHKLHAIDFWKVIDEKTFDRTLESWKKKRYKIVDERGPTRPRTHYLEEPEDGYEGYICISQFVRECWGLFRKQTNTALWSTGATDWMQWGLSDDGVMFK